MELGFISIPLPISLFTMDGRLVVLLTRFWVGFTTAFMHGGVWPCTVDTKVESLQDKNNDIVL
jgi:hypothetical protein